MCSASSFASRVLEAGECGALDCDGGVESPPHELSLSCSLVVAVVEETEGQPAPVDPQALGQRRWCRDGRHRRLVLRLERLGEPLQVAPGKRGQVPAHGERGAVPLRHLEVDAALDSSGKRRVGSRPFTDAQATSQILDFEDDPPRCVVEVRGETTEQPRSRGPQHG